MTRRQLLGIVLAVCAAGVAWTEVVPLERAHSHNDYAHERPLLDALDHGFCSVEADINLIDGALLVAHSTEETKPEGTLQAMYLEPLRARIKENDGRVYRGSDIQFWLLIDIKGRPDKTWPVLNTVLEAYADILTSYKGTDVKVGPISVVVDNADRYIAATDNRWAAIDGRLPDLERNTPVHLMPWVSSAWDKAFTWNGTGPMPAEELEKLRQIVTQAHGQGKKVRFWGLPRPAVVWPVLYEAGVDLLNTDDHGALRDFLLQQR